MSKNQPQDDKIIQNAQYRKSLSIAFFNATNAAVEMCKGLNINEENTKEKIIEVRNWLLEEHKNYYASIIANVGQNYKAEESIAKLKVAKTLEDLQITWRLLSEDERHDGEIRKFAQELKKKLQ